MIKTSKFFFVLVQCVVLFGVFAVYAAENPKDNKPQKMAKVTTKDYYRNFTINNIFNFFSNSGDASNNVYTGNSGLEWPKGSTKTAIFEDGFIFGAKYDGTFHVGGSAYRFGWQPGRILVPGVKDADSARTSPNDARYRVYVVRPDINPSTPLDDKLKQILESGDYALTVRYDASASVQKIYDSYIKDWNEWPATDGAPYKDVDSNGVYNPAIDIPGVPGADQTLWFVSNDLDKAATTNLYGSNPVGIEMQKTIWGYNRFGALGNAYFTKFKLINKSGQNLDSMFVSVWSDPDLGDAGDDFVGCDTLLSLGYVYNGKPSETVYGSTPPAAGYDFFQGPLVNGIAGEDRNKNGVDDAVDFGIVNGKKQGPGKINLPMSSFNFFINGNALYTDPSQGVIAGTTHWYNLMRGLITTTGAPNIDPVTGKETKFAFYGDPVTKQGWVDGKIFSGGKAQVIPPGDRRLSMTAGPFTMNIGDTQEVVVATLVGGGDDNLKSVSVLKSYDRIAQAAYDANFDLAPAPEKPVVKIASLSNKIVLDWGDPVTANKTENQDSKGFKFQGYNIYQLKSNSFNEGNYVRLQTFDKDDGLGYIEDLVYDNSTGVLVVKPVQFGTNTGISRQLILTEDKYTSLPLVNGKRYYYAVTAYSYNPIGVPKTLESAPVILEIIPQDPAPGVRYPSKVDDLIKVTKTGSSEGAVTVRVVDPSKLTGHNYEVVFDTVTIIPSGLTTVWSLVDKTLSTTLINKRVLQGIKDFVNPGVDDDFYTVDGIQVKVATVVSLYKDAQFIGVREGKGRWTATGGVVDSLKLESFKSSPSADVGAIGNGFDHWITSSTFNKSYLRNILILYASTDALGKFSPADTNASYGYRYVFNTLSSIPPLQKKYVLVKEDGLPYQDFTKSVPFAAYDIESNPPRRLAVGYTENVDKLGKVDGSYWPPLSSLGNNIKGGYMEWFFIFNKTYSETTEDPDMKVNLMKTKAPIMVMGTPARASDDGWTFGDSLKLTRSLPNVIGDNYAFSTIAPTVNATTAKDDINKINVFPNPYFGFNSQELNKYNRFVTFNHLPKVATIRVYNLSGVLLKTIKKDDNTQFATWNLKNEASLPAAAGMYIVHIDMPELGAQKILKLAIIPEAQFLDKY